MAPADDDAVLQFVDRVLYDLAFGGPMYVGRRPGAVPGRVMIQSWTTAPLTRPRRSSDGWPPILGCPALHPDLQLVDHLVERWFSELTTTKLKRSAHQSVCAPNADIRAWIENRNEGPRPYV
jgi:hypothetical protein